MYTTFDELVGNMALNAPHAVIMDWHLRLDRAINGYFHAMQQTRPERISGVYTELRRNPLLGHEDTAAMSRLRRIRNAVVHKNYQPDAAEAEQYAREAHRLSWLLLEAVGDRPFPI